MNISLIGYGKMGQAIEIEAINRGHTIVGKFGSKAEISISNLKIADVAIEFTNPTSAVKNIQLCLESQTPVVVGTTGWYEQFREVINQVEKQDGTLLHATNFSLGVNIFFQINEMLAGLMNERTEYSISVSETHHTQKLDAPSGTAITIAEQIVTQINRLKSWGYPKTPEASSLDIEAYREPDVPGTHTVTCDSEADTIEIKHTAKSRRGFAQGAVMAAEFIHDKTGVFTMQDVLKL